MTISEALERMHTLAELGVLEDDDPGMADEVQRQKEAVNTAGDFIGNYWEELDETFAGFSTGEGDVDLEALREIAKTTGHPLAQAMAVTIELACQQIVENDPDIQSKDDEDAVTCSARFWKAKGAEICGKTISLDTSPLF